MNAMNNEFAALVSQLAQDSNNVQGDMLVTVCEGYTMYEELDVLTIDLGDDGIGGA